MLVTMRNCSAIAQAQLQVLLQSAVFHKSITARNQISIFANLKDCLGPLIHHTLDYSIGVGVSSLSFLPSYVAPPQSNFEPKIPAGGFEASQDPQLKDLKFYN